MNEFFFSKFRLSLCLEKKKRLCKEREREKENESRMDEWKKKRDPDGESHQDQQSFTAFEL